MGTPSKRLNHISEAAAIAGFCDAMRAAGLEPPEHINGDGTVQRFATNRKRNDDAGWYVLFLDGTPAGSFGNWRAGFTQTWSAIEREHMNPQQAAEFAERMRSAARARANALKMQHDQTAVTAVAIWQRAQRVTGQGHPYLERKGVQAHGARVIGFKDAQAMAFNLSRSLDAGLLLVVPMLTAWGQIRSLQFITASGTKRPLTGGQKSGCFMPMGQPKGGASGAVVIVCEGFATGASIHEATGHAVAVAFDRVNLGNVCRELRKKHGQHISIIVAGDDDHLTEGNPGRTDAQAAALAAGGVALVPSFNVSRPIAATDFNDLHTLEGLAAVAACFATTLDCLTHAVEA